MALALVVVRHGISFIEILVVVLVTRCDLLLCSLPPTHIAPHRLVDDALAAEVQHPLQRARPARDLLRLFPRRGLLVILQLRLRLLCCIC